MQTWLKARVLSGNGAILQPMELAHSEGMAEAIKDGNLNRLWYTSVPSPEDVNAYIETALQEQEDGRSIPFTVLHRSTGNIIGSTRFMNIEARHRRAEIGTTWYAQSMQRTGINTQCKALLLSYLFDDNDAIAVEFRTHWHNHSSRAAIERLGAKQDAILRSHQLDADGNLRDTVVYSIIAAEWPTVKRSLNFKLDCYSA